MPDPTTPAPPTLVDPCPTCHRDVDHVIVTHTDSHAFPCGHAVTVTIHPDRIELAPHNA